MNVLSAYNKSVFLDFENYLRTVVDLAEDDIRVVLDEYNSNLITDEIKPGIYTFKDLSEVLTKISQFGFDGFNNSNNIEFNDITMKTKFFVRPDIIASRFDEKSFFNSILVFNAHWDYKHYKEYISPKTIKLSKIDEIHLKCDVIDGSVVNGIREPVLFSFILDKRSGYEVFCQPETINYKKIN